MKQAVRRYKEFGFVFGNTRRFFQLCAKTFNAVLVAKRTLSGLALPVISASVPSMLRFPPIFSV